MARPKMILTADQVLTRKAMAWATKIRVTLSAARESCRSFPKS